MRWIDLIWPTLEYPTDAEKARLADRRKSNLDEIDAAVLAADEDTLIEEARRLGDAETDRRKTAETKAAIYLTVVGVLAPILATIAPEALEPRNGWFRLIATLTLFLTTGAYLLKAGVWAMRALVVSSSSHQDPGDLIRLWAGAARKSGLAKALMADVLRNREGINIKVTAVIMAQHFVVRAFVMFILAMLVRSGWKPVAAVVEQMGNLLR